MVCTLLNLGLAGGDIQKLQNNLFPPPLRSGGNARVAQLTPDSPSAPLRGEPGVRTDAPPGHCSTRALCLKCEPTKVIECSSDDGSHTLRPMFSLRRCIREQ